ncbi:MAG: DUF2087 domain-containing protein [Rhodothermaceae bacterium]
MTASIEHSLKIMKVMADESRLLILNILFEKPQYVEEISKRLDLAPSTVSFHLKKLEELDLVIKEKKQYYSEFRIKKEVFDSKLIDLIRFKNVEKVAQENRIKKSNDKVISAFIKNGKIEKLPRQLKKKLLIMEWISEKFSYNKSYSEMEVNEIIGKYYDDYCTVRRYMVDYNYFERKKNVYKKLKTGEQND